MSARLEERIEQHEAAAAKAVSELALALENMCYRLECEDVTPATAKELLRAARVTHEATEFYYGEDSPLVWLPPSPRFKKKASN